VERKEVTNECAIVPGIGESEMNKQPLYVKVKATTTTRD
tara:strand:- start:1558 stop:1674 length:117 start_codon:yes stop_codon:yes gene_type:complete